MNHHGNVDLEILAVSSIIVNEEVGEYAAVLLPRWLSHEPARRAWNLATEYYSDHRESPPRELVRAEIPAFKFKVGSGSVEGVVESLQTMYLRGQIETIYEDEVTCMEEPSATLAALVSQLTAVQAGIQRDTGSDISATIRESYDRYLHRKEHKGSLGLPFCWGPLQRETNGAQLGEYIIIYARPKQQKTFVMLKQIQHWVKHCRRRVLLVTREMSKNQLQDRLYCIWTGVDYKLFRKGGLSAHEERKLEDAIQEIETQGKIIVETVETYGAEAASEIGAMADQYGLEEGDVVACDGMDWFAKDERWESLRSFSKGLKKVAQGGKKADGKNKRSLIVLATGQGNQNFKSDQNADAGKEMSGGDGPIRDCDVALKLQFNRDDLEILIDIAAIREGDSIRFTINAIPCSDYSVKYSDEPEEDARTATMPAPVIGAKKKKPKGSKNAKPKDVGPRSTGKRKLKNLQSKGKKRPKGAGLDPSKVKWPEAS